MGSVVVPCAHVTVNQKRYLKTNIIRDVYLQTARLAQQTKKIN